MRQSAFYAATPERPKHDKSDAPLLTRLQKLRKDKKNEDYQPDMPEITAPHLVARLFEVGPFTPGDMGPKQITFLEIDAWCNRTGVDLQPFETRFLRSLSMDYINELHRAEKWDAKAPWDVVRAQIVAQSVKDYLEGLAKL